MTEVEIIVATAHPTYRRNVLQTPWTEIWQKMSKISSKYAYLCILGDTSATFDRFFGQGAADVTLLLSCRI